MFAGGPNTTIMSWGGEVCAIYECILKGDLKIFRALNNDLIHRWHFKACLSTDVDATSH